MKECYYKSIVGQEPKCNQNCEECDFYLEESVEADKNAQDELPI